MRQVIALAAFLMFAHASFGQVNTVWPPTSTAANVGLGANPALAKFHVAAGVSTSALMIQGDNLFSVKVRTYTDASFTKTHRITQVYNNDDLDRNGFIDYIRGGNNSGGELALGSNGIERLRISAAGKVGIGTSTPYGWLDVAGTNGAVNDPIARFGSTGLTDANSLKLYNGSVTLTSFVAGANDNFMAGAVKGDAGFAINGVDAKSFIIGDAVKQRMILTSNGNMGIGTAAPTSKLEVQGNGGGILAINCRATDATTTARLSLINPSQNWAISNYVNVGFGISDEIAGAARLIINSSGNVGIGTTTPGSNKLAVEGTIGARKVKVTQLAWSDYVFDSTYALSPLEVVESFIAQNKHLPDVPSAATVEKEGIDLGDNQATLLRKIEELTLYMIDLNKTVKQQSDLIRDQQAQISLLKKEKADK